MLLLLPVSLPAQSVSAFRVNQPVARLDSGWSYRWGDPAIAATNEGWHAASNITALPGKGTNRILWLRITLPPGEWNDCALYLSSAHQMTEIRLDGKEIFRWGSEKNLFSGISAHLIPLTMNSSNGVLSFRFETFGPRLGLLRNPEIGSRADLLREILRRDIPSILFALFYLLSAVILAFLVLFRVLVPRYLSLGLILLSVGAFSLSQAVFRQFIFGNDSVFWGVFELSSIYLVPLGITLFLRFLLERPGKFGGFFWLFVSAAVWTVGIIAAGAVDPNLLLLALPGFQVYMLALLVALAALVMSRAWNGEREAQLLSFGFLVFLGALAFDTLVSMGFLPRRIFLFNWGMFVFVVILMDVLVNRVFRTWRENENYSRLLEQKHIAVLDAQRDLESLTGELDMTRRELIIQLSEIAEARSQDTGNHVRRVAAYCQVLGREYGLPLEDLQTLVLVAPLHDVGKLGIPDAILNKSGALTDEEYALVKSHTTIGYELFGSSRSGFFRSAAIVAHEHHERYDGLGYPRGVAGKNIHVFGRMVALADIFDTLCCDKVYKKAWEIGRVIEYIQQESGGHFEPELVDIFMGSVEQFLSIRKTWKDSLVV
jgi:hypothetical protein